MEFAVLLPIIAKILPGIMHLFAGPTAGTALQQVGDAAKAIFGTTDPKQIETLIERDKQITERFKAEVMERTESTRLFLQDLQSARAMNIESIRAGSPQQWFPMALTAIIVIGFFLAIVIFMRISLELPEFQKTVLNVLIGYLGASFQQAFNFWFGTTRDSQTKTGTLASIASSATTSSTEAVRSAVDAVKGNGGGLRRMFKS